MNYIDQVNRFFELDLEYSFTPMEVAIYFRLLDRSNSLAWKNPFGFSCDELRAKVRCKNAESKKPFDTARNRLKQAGLIDFVNGNGRGHVTKYTLKGALKGIQIEPLSVPLSEPLSGDSGCYINKHKLNKKESIDVNQPLPAMVLEAAEMNQWTHTKNRNTDFLKEQWKVYLLERTNDPPAKIREYAQNQPELCRYFLNWIRNKFPKNGTAKNIPAPSGKQAGNDALFNRAKNLFAGGTAND